MELRQDKLDIYNQRAVEHVKIIKYLTFFLSQHRPGLGACTAACQTAAITAGTIGAASPLP